VDVTPGVHLKAALGADGPRAASEKRGILAQRHGIIKKMPDKRVDGRPPANRIL